MLDQALTHYSNPDRLLHYDLLSMETPSIGVDMGFKAFSGYSVGVYPESFKIIECSGLFVKDMYNHVAVVHQYPEPFFIAFNAQRVEAFFP